MNQNNRFIISLPLPLELVLTEVKPNQTTSDYILESGLVTGEYLKYIVRYLLDTCILVWNELSQFVSTDNTRILSHIGNFSMEVVELPLLRVVSKQGVTKVIRRELSNEGNTKRKTKTGLLCLFRIGYT